MLDRQRLKAEIGYRLRTTASYFRMRGKHNEEPAENWIENEIDATMERILTFQNEEFVPTVELVNRATRAVTESINDAAPELGEYPADRIIAGAVLDVVADYLNSEKPETASGDDESKLDTIAFILSPEWLRGRVLPQMVGSEQIAQIESIRRVLDGTYRNL